MQVSHFKAGSQVQPGKEAFPPLSPESCASGLTYLAVQGDQLGPRDLEMELGSKGFTTSLGLQF